MPSQRRRSKMKENTSKRTAITQSKRAGTDFPVGRIGRLLRRGAFAKNVGNLAAVAMATTLEFIVSDLLELAGTFTLEMKKKRVTPRAIFKAIQDDEELKKIFCNVLIHDGGYKEHIEEVLTQKVKRSKKSRKASQSQMV